jgi:HipA-like protein
MKKSVFDLLTSARFWGTKRIPAPSTMPTESTLEVYLQSDGQPTLVGCLSWEQGEYVFRYEPSYTGRPISAFPEVGQEYRSRYLWPFFATRIPPLDREDMRKVINERKLNEDQTIEILGSIARLSTANPYEFRLAGG